MSLSLQEVEHIANLARLELAPEELARYREQLAEILAYFERLQALDTAGVTPASGALTTAMPLRPDRARPGLSTQALLANAPQAADDQFQVPAVLE